MLVEGIVRAEGGGIVIENYGFVAKLRVVAAEVINECRYLSLELDVERLNHIESAVAWLTTDDSVDVGVVVHADAEWCIGVNVRIVNTAYSGIGAML